MSKLDLSRFKKVKSGPNHTVMRHPKGHEITIFHKDLSKPLKKQLDDLPHYKDGGDVEVAPTPRPLPNKNLEPGNSGQGVGGNLGPQGAQSTQDSMRKAFKFAKGGTAKLEEPSIPLEQQFGPYSDERPGDKYTTSPVNGGTGVNTDVPYDYADTDNTANKAADRVMATPTPISTQQEITQAANDTPAPITPPGDVSKLVDAHSALVKHVTAQSPSSPMGQPTPQTQGQPAPVLNPGGSLTNQARYNTEQQAQAEMGMAQNEAKTQDQMASIYGDQAKQMQDLHAQYQTIGNQIHQKFVNTAIDVEKGHIDPNHWWNSKDTGGKVLSLVGMLLGGLGGGISGHPEQMNNVVNQFIDRDIASQKADLENKHTLLGKYLEMYKSLPEAEAAARLTMGAGVEGLIKQQAAKLGSQNAIIAAQKAVGGLRNSLLPQLEGLTRGQMVMNAINETSSDKSTDPAHKIRKLSMMGLMKPEQQTAAEKELGSVQRINKLQDDVEESARDLNSRALNGALTPSLRQSQMNTFAGVLAKEAEGRFNLEEAKAQMKALMPSPLDNKDTLKIKSENRRKFFDSMKTTPTLDSYSIHPGGNAPHTDSKVFTGKDGKQYTVDPTGKYAIPVK